jgi:hypothetical protein
MEETTTPPQQHPDDSYIAEPYTVWEMVYWVVGILSIPLVPIIMVKLLTPMSGV